MNSGALTQSTENSMVKWNTASKLAVKMCGKPLCLFDLLSASTSVALLDDSFGSASTSCRYLENVERSNQLTHLHTCPDNSIEKIPAIFSIDTFADFEKPTRRNSRVQSAPMRDKTHDQRFKWLPKAWNSSRSIGEIRQRE